MAEALSTRLARSLTAAHRRTREWRMLASGVLDTDHPVLAHIIPTRRCNLACTYCNEFDDFSKPVPLEEMYRRIDRLGELGIRVISFSGGEPLLCDHLELLIRRIRETGAIAGTITNGLLLTADRIRKLNDAGLEHMQISIDNVVQDDVSKKSLRVLDKKLQLLAEHAYFHVNINSVVGGGIHNPQDAIVVAKRAVELGFTSTIGIIHDSSESGFTSRSRKCRAGSILSPGSATKVARESYARMELLPRKTSPTAVKINGSAAPAALAISTSAKTSLVAHCTAHSSAAIPASLSPITRRTIFAA